MFILNITFLSEKILINVYFSKLIREKYMTIMQRGGSFR